MSISYNGDIGYASDKLTGSIVSLRGYPVMVNFFEDGMVCYNFMGGPREFCHLEDLDLTPIKLGYVNHPRGASYLSRIPARFYRQGIRANTLNVSGGNHYNFDRYLNNTVRGIYPSFKNCLEGCFNKDFKSLAFGRRWALSQRYFNAEQRNSIRLEYRGKPVGFLDKKNEEPVLTDGLQYLKESLEEVLNDGK